jgi:hypothetical protein
MAQDVQHQIIPVPIDGQEHDEAKGEDAAHAGKIDKIYIYSVF